MSYRYEQGFLTNEETDYIFDNAGSSMVKIHEEQGPYKKIADYLTDAMGMKDPLGVQTFYIGQGYDIEFAHIDVATAFFPSITNVWFCSEDCAGESFGFLEMHKQKEAYAPFLAALERGDMTDFEPLCDEKYFDDYTKIVDYKKGDMLFFDSRTVHRKLSATARKTLVFKYINSEDLADLKPWNYATIPPGPQWVRFLVFDKLRHIEGHEERKRFLRETECLIGSEAPPRADSGAKQKKASILQRLLKSA